MLTPEYIKVLTQLLAGNREYTPNYLYLWYTDGSSDSYLRIPITIKPTVDEDKVTYMALVGADETDVAVDTAITKVSLVVAPAVNDDTQDIILSEQVIDEEKQLTLGVNQTLCFSFQLSLIGVMSDVEDTDDYWNEE